MILEFLWSLYAIYWSKNLEHHGQRPSLLIQMMIGLWNKTVLHMSSWEITKSHMFTNSWARLLNWCLSTGCPACPSGRAALALLARWSLPPSPSSAQWSRPCPSLGGRRVCAPPWATWPSSLRYSSSVSGPFQNVARMSIIWWWCWRSAGCAPSACRVRTLSLQEVPPSSRQMGLEVGRIRQRLSLQAWPQSEPIRWCCWPGWARWGRGVPWGAGWGAGRGMRSRGWGARGRHTGWQPPLVGAHKERKILGKIETNLHSILIICEFDWGSLL